MTESKIKEMISDIVNNGATYMCRHNTEKGCTECACNCGKDYDLHCGINHWHEYKLGEEIHNNWEYQKVSSDEDDIYYVVTMLGGDLGIIKNKPQGNYLHSGTIADCKKYIADNQIDWLERLKKCFFETSPLSTDRKGDVLMGIDYGATEISKEILNRITEYKNANEEILTINEIKKIISDLGITL